MGGEIVDDVAMFGGRSSETAWREHGANMQEWRVFLQNVWVLMWAVEAPTTNKKTQNGVIGLFLFWKSLSCSSFSSQG